ncbi:hypothetical protein [Galbitalea soli]|uniref:Uncharacterized protein n=1 Tax=Galbitalea soli TaxID=1268042 RepID=A0A7C9PPX5_9MICO|nr:hypothetical protein [Galbitalea soli]NEM92431.1 hypothetical protein [Galbitalea soli]NYJ29466.1 high-affinity Fe2+/Pb2+ permease [Galbitalea soli]
MTDSYAPVHQSDTVVRGALFAAIIIPVGVVVWTIVWSWGIVASIVALGIAVAAGWLYRKGAGRMTTAGAAVIAGVVIVTLLLSFFAGVVWDFAGAVARETGTSTWAAFTSPQFWPLFSLNLPLVLKADGTSLLLAAAFGALGSFRTISAGFKAARAEATSTAMFGEAPAAPQPTGSEDVPPSASH